MRATIVCILDNVGRTAYVNIPTLIIPGIGNSDEADWQTIWESTNPEFFRVQQAAGLE